LLTIHPTYLQLIVMQMQLKEVFKRPQARASDTGFYMVAEAHQPPEEVATGETKPNQLSGL
jgi:hypothetical protein